ncbi:MAG: sulfatase-like hydrolase/transferase [Planctomycetaceae bacterium]|nr:sulfatase-like hydrolase/transferase [Planctomycetaceae bacterium]
MRRPTIFPSPQRAFFLLLPLLGMNWATPGPGLSAADRPNILLIVTDDQGYWDLGVTGNSDIETPNMDSLARDGVQFRRFYVAPVCAPTRAGIQTGRYYLRTGLYNTRFGGDTMGKDEITVAQLLKKAGYATGLFGKWHLGRYCGYHPNQRGFDEFLGHYHGHIERYSFPDQIYHNDQPVEARGYVTDLFTNAAVDFIRTPRDNPFFCMLAYNAPHSPWLLDTSHFGQPEGDKLLKKYLDKGLEMREARIYALVDRVDQNLGRLFAFLKESGKEENTVVLFMSDNGGVSKHFKAGLKGNKASSYEGGVRSPLFVRWPGKFPAGGVVEGQASHVDLLPTFCELAGAERPADRKLDGKSLVPLLRAGKGATHHPYVYHTWDRYFPNPDRRWSVSDQRWKLVGLFGDRVQPDPSKWMLYDLQNDPGEEKNLAKQHPDKVAELRAEFVRWFNEVTDGVTYAPIPIPVGNPEAPVVEIQASWGQCEGPNVNYTFDGYDWDTIDGWKQPGEKVVWNLDVLAAGQYEVTVTYGCAPSGMGGRFCVRAGEDASLTAEVKPTSNPEVFERFTLGTLRLPAGKARLTVEALDVKGSELMRLNRVWLRKTDVPSE